MTPSLTPAPAEPASFSPPTPIRLGLVCDFVEEQWASMDMVGEMVLRHLALHQTEAVAATRICPPMPRRASRLPVVGRRGIAWNVDRLLGRFWDYPREAARLARSGRFDLFHLVDHSYSQLVHDLPADRTVVTCHDLDTFRCVLEPEKEPRPRWFRSMARRILSGLQKAARVACDSEATRSAILRHGLLPDDRLSVVHLAVHPECRPEPHPEADARADRLLGAAWSDRLNLLHVGTNIARKRIDVLLKTFAAIRRNRPDVHLIKVGGAFTAEQSQLAAELGLDATCFTILPFFSPRSALDRETLAAVYRRAALVLQPSEAEGFGLPVAEALASGAVVLASDIPVLREVGGEPVLYAPVGDVEAWTEAALSVLDAFESRDPSWTARRSAGLSWADRYRWSTHVEQLVSVYRAILS